MEWGANEEFFANLPEDAPTPKALLNAPSLWASNQEFLDAFAILSGSRQAGMGIGVIPLTEVVAYVQLYQPDDPITLARRIRLCDDIYLDWQAKKQAANNAKQR